MLVFNGNKQKTDIPHLDTIHCILPSSFRVWFGRGGGVWIFFFSSEKCTHRIHILCHHMQTFVIFFLAGFWVWLFVVEMKNLKNNAYSIQKLWMGEWKCQLYVHYMFWCNQKHWEYVVLCCKKNQSISDIAVLFVENKTTELRGGGFEASVCEWEHCAGLPVVWHHLLFVCRAHS